MHEKSLAQKLEILVARRRGVLSISSDSTCVTVAFRNGSFCATSCEHTLEWNLRTCIEFTENCLIGTVGPARKPAINNLGQIASLILKLQEDYDTASEMDALFDCGEFSGPAQARAFERELDELLAQYGLTREIYNEELNNRIRMNYRRHCTLRV